MGGGGIKAERVASWYFRVNVRSRLLRRESSRGGGGHHDHREYPGPVGCKPPPSRPCHSCGGGKTLAWLYFHVPVWSGVCAGRLLCVVRGGGWRMSATCVPYMLRGKTGVSKHGNPGFPLFCPLLPRAWPVLGRGWGWGYRPPMRTRHAPAYCPSRTHRVPCTASRRPHAGISAMHRHCHPPPRRLFRAPASQSAASRTLTHPPRRRSPHRMQRQHSARANTPNPPEC